ncbi:MAG: hypothetical protein WCI72_02315 [archaeon]
MIADNPGNENSQVVIKNGRKEISPYIAARSIIHPPDNGDIYDAISHRNFYCGGNGYIARFETELRQIAKSMKNEPNNRTKNEGLTLEKRILELKRRQPFIVNGGGNMASVSDHSEVVEMWKKEERKYQLQMKATFYERTIVKVAAAAIIGFAGYKYGLPYLTPFVDNFRGISQGIEKLEKRDDLTKYGLISL